MILVLLVGLAALAVAWDTSTDQRLVAWCHACFATPPLPPREFPPLPLNPAQPPGATPESMVWVPGGWFWMGSDEEYPLDVGPTHKVYVDGFWMGKFEVTNAEWAQFVKATGYKTYCERPLDPTDFPKKKAEWIKKKPACAPVFTPPDGPVPLDDPRQWWDLVEGANWQHPEGPETNIRGRDRHPVVHIAWIDAAVFLDWKNQQKPPAKGWTYRLPTEAEWEFAARGGKNRCKYPWGDELTPGAKWQANIWQGRFPYQNTREDGYEEAAPVGSFPPNGFGLHDMAGNVWEWCYDSYESDYYKRSPERNPSGPLVSFDPYEPGAAKKVQRGGSFLCDATYCEAYLVYVRGKGEITSSANHVGFRYVLAPKIGWP
jgi:formylglycine-generating enzyme required for sulfatase activity